MFSLSLNKEEKVIIDSKQEFEQYKTYENYFCRNELEDYHKSVSKHSRQAAKEVLHQKQVSFAVSQGYKKITANSKEWRKSINEPRVA